MQTGLKEEVKIYTNPRLQKQPMLTLSVTIDVFLCRQTEGQIRYFCLHRGDKLTKMGLCGHTLVKIKCVEIISCEFNRKISNKGIKELF